MKKIDVNKILKFALILIIPLSVIVYIVYYMLTSPDVSLVPKFSPQKITSISKTHIAGWESGKKLWEFFAEEAWSTKFGRETTLEDVKDGFVYKDGKPVVKNLKAKLIKIFKYSNDVEAFRYKDNEVGELSAWIDLGKITKGGTDETNLIFVSADRLKYKKNENKTLLEGNVKIRGKNIILVCNMVEVYHDKKEAVISDTPKITILKKKKTDIETKISGKKIVADFEGNKFQIIEDVKITQGNKAIVGEKAIYDREKNLIKISKNVKSLVEKAEALLGEESAEKLKKYQAKDILSEKTIVYCDNLEILSSEKDALAYGNVTITQKANSAKADRATYSSEKEEITLTGNVFIKKDNEWLKTERVVVSIKDETFKAEGEVETKFKLKK